MTTNPKVNGNHLPQMPEPHNALLHISKGKSVGIEIHLESEEEKCIPGNKRASADHVSQT